MSQSPQPPSPSASKPKQPPSALFGWAEVWSCSTHKGEPRTYATLAREYWAGAKKVHSKVVPTKDGDPIQPQKIKGHLHIDKFLYTGPDDIDQAELYFQHILYNFARDIRDGKATPFPGPKTRKPKRTAY